MAVNSTSSGMCQELLSGPVAGIQFRRGSGGDGVLEALRREDGAAQKEPIVRLLGG